MMPKIKKACVMPKVSIISLILVCSCGPEIENHRQSLESDPVGKTEEIGLSKTQSSSSDMKVLTLKIEGEGEVIGPGVSCTRLQSPCRISIKSGTKFRLLAKQNKSAPRTLFLGWDDDCPPGLRPTCGLTMNRDKTVTANFYYLNDGKGCPAATYLNDATGRCEIVQLGYYSPANDNQQYACSKKPVNAHWLSNATHDGYSGCWYCDKGLRYTNNGCQNGENIKITGTDGNFGALKSGRYRDRYLQMNNIGASKISFRYELENISSSSVESDFTFQNRNYPGKAGNCGNSLEPGESCRIFIRFHARRLNSGAKEGSMTFFVKGGETVTRRFFGKALVE